MEIKINLRSDRLITRLRRFPDLVQFRNLKSTFVKIPVALILGVFLLMLSCATKKSKEDVSFLGKVYHNTTAKYNGYFNADEIRTAAYLQLEGSNQDNYTEVLKIFPWQGGDADKVKGELDRAIEKVSIVAASHEVSHWRDERDHHD